MSGKNTLEGLTSIISDTLQPRFNRQFKFCSLFIRYFLEIAPPLTTHFTANMFVLVNMILATAVSQGNPGPVLKVVIEIMSLPAFTN